MCSYWLTFAGIADGAVVFDVGGTDEEDCGSSGFGAGQTFTLNADGTLHWTTGDGWSATLFPFAGNLTG